MHSGTFILHFLWAVYLPVSSSGWLDTFLGLRPAFDYGLVIDAGSHGSRIHVFQWPHRQFDTRHPFTGPLSFPREVGAKSVEPGISSFADSPDRVGRSLGPLIEYAKKVLKNEQGRWGSFPLWLKATAGMRDLERDVRGGVMEGIRLLFANKSFCPFLSTYEMVRVLSGEEEGALGWLSVNYAKGSLFEGSLGTLGALDMGGASTQITFQPQHTSILENFFPIHLGDHFIRLYTHSFLGYGWGDALLRSVDREAVDATLKAMASAGISPSSLPAAISTRPPPPAVPSAALKKLEEMEKKHPLGSPVSAAIDTEDDSAILPQRGASGGAVEAGAEDEDRPRSSRQETRESLQEGKATKKEEEGSRKESSSSSSSSYSLLKDGSLSPSEREALTKVRALKVSVQDPCYPSGYAFSYPLDRLVDPDKGLVGVTEKFLGDLVAQAGSRKKALKVVKKIAKETDREEAMEVLRDSALDAETEGVQTLEAFSAIAQKNDDEKMPRPFLSDADFVFLHRRANELLKIIGTQTRDKGEKQKQQGEGGIEADAQEKKEEFLHSRIRSVLRLLSGPSADFFSSEYEGEMLRTERIEEMEGEEGSVDPLEKTDFIRLRGARQSSLTDDSQRLAQTRAETEAETAKTKQSVQNQHMESERQRPTIEKEKDDPMSVLDLYSHSRHGLEPFGEAVNFPEGGLNMTVEVHGRGDFDACAQRIQSFFYKDAPCFDHTCAFNGIYMPRILDSKFVAFGVYSEVKNDLGLSSSASLEEWAEAGRKKCKKTMEDLNKAWKEAGAKLSDRELLPVYCFQAAWMHQVLNFGYEFENHTRTVTFLSDLDGLDPGWASGSILFDVNFFFWDMPPSYWQVGFWVALAGLFFVSVVACCFGAQLRKIRSQTGEAVNPLHSHTPSMGPGSTRERSGGPPRSLQVPRAPQWGSGGGDGGSPLSPEAEGHQSLLIGHPQPVGRQSRQQEGVERPSETVRAPRSSSGWLLKAKGKRTKKSRRRVGARLNLWTQQQGEEALVLAGSNGKEVTGSGSRYQDEIRSHHVSECPPEGKQSHCQNQLALRCSRSHPLASQQQTENNEATQGAGLKTSLKKGFSGAAGAPLFASSLFSPSLWNKYLKGTSIDGLDGERREPLIS